MKTYKYLGKIASELFLTNKTIRFSQPKAFNDPFELQPEFVVTDDSIQENEESNCQFVLNGHQSCYEQYLLKDNFCKTQTKKTDNKSMLSQLNEQIGILCLTQADTLIPSNFLMWSHYSESHQGIVLEFKKDSEFTKNTSSVKYLPRRPIIDAKILYEKEFVSISDLFFKSDVWHYENELRITKKLDACIKLESNDVMGNPIYVCEVPIDSIECIYVGCNANDKIKSSAFDFHKSTNVKVMFLKIHDEEYKLIPFSSFGQPFKDMYELHENILFDRQKI